MTTSASVLTVQERLRRAILTGELAPGSVIAQAALGETFDAGRTPLREALRMLQGEGLVISEPNRPVRIAPLSADDLEQIYITRIALENVAAQVTVPGLTSADVADLEACMARMAHFARHDDHDGFRGPHREFHVRLVGGAGDRIADEIRRLMDHTERYRALVVDDVKVRDERGAWPNVHVDHREILDAAAAGDAGLTAKRLVEHYASNAALTFPLVDPGYETVQLREAIAAVTPD